MKIIGVLLMAIALFPGLVWGQEEEGSETTTSVEAPSEATTDGSSQASASAPMEKIEVTGSHIKRIDVEGPSPVLTLDREYLDRTGYNSVADVLRDTTVAGLGGQRETGLNGGAEGGVGTTSIRGMGADTILVLLDGRRLPTIGGSTRVDLNLIPMAAIERVEILKDGASAIYGSDALGGVINFITKRNYDGAVLNFNYSLPEAKGGAKTDVTGTYGITGSKYDVLAVAQYRTNESVAMRDRDFFIPTGGGSLSPTGSPGSYKNHSDAGDQWNAGGGADPCNGPVDGRGRCQFDYSPFMNTVPMTVQSGALVSGGYRFNEELEVFARGMYSRRENNAQLAPPPDGFQDESDPDTGGLDTRVPKAVADSWGLNPGTTSVNPSSPGNDVDVIYRPVEELGPRINRTTSDTFGLVSGVKGYVTDTWEWELSGNYSQTKNTNRGINGYANKNIMRQLAIDGDFNPFAAPGSKNDLTSAIYTPVLDINSSIGGTQLSATGEVFELASGPVAAAVGVSANWQTFEQTSDAVTSSGAMWGGGTDAQGSGLRDFQSAYTEFSIPLLTSLEMQVAGRFDNYSDFGSTVNPKVAFRYKPSNSLMLRGSWGTGFRAPALQDLYEASSIQFPFGTDPVTGEAAQYKTFSAGNPNLKEETSQSLNVGAVWQFLKGLSLGVDYYKTTQDDLVQRVTDETIRDLFRAETAGIDLSQHGIQVVRNPANTGSIERIIAPTLNLARRKTEGLEFRLGYSIPVFGSWRLNSIVDYALLLSVEEVPFPGMAAEERVGFSGNPYWRNNISLGLANQTWGFNALVKTIGEQNASVTQPGVGGKTRDHTELDLQGQYATPWNGLFAIGVRNVFNTDRPWMSEHLSNGFLDTDLYDPFGRTVFTSYTQNF